MKKENPIKTRIVEHNKKADYISGAETGIEKVRWHANDSIEQFIKKGELDDIQKRVEEAFQDVLDAMVIDTENDHNTRDTAKRVAKMFVREIFSGRFEPMPKVTAFPNTGGGNGGGKYNQIYISGPITIRSTCAHHMMPIVGNCWIGVKPGDTVIGLSKFNRLVDWIANRPQIQEEMTEQIADIIEEQTSPEALAVVIKAQHFCLTHRGVREHESDMTTSVMRGKFRDEPALRNEFLTLMNNMKGHG